MLVYHFKGRLVILEQKCDTMFEIMNNMIKELKAIQARSFQAVHSGPSVPSSVPSGFPGGFPMDILSMLGGRGFQTQEYNEEGDEGDDGDDGDEGDDDDEGDDEPEFKKIVVSDTEFDSDDEDDERVKVIHIDIGEPAMNPDDLPELEEIEPEESLDDVDAEVDGEEYLETSIDYKKMEIGQLRTLVLSRGLATDAKKMKKADLIKLLSDE